MTSGRWSNGSRRPGRNACDLVGLRWRRRQRRGRDARTGSRAGLAAMFAHAVVRTRKLLEHRLWNLVHHAAAGVPNQVVSAPESPSWVRFPTKERSANVSAGPDQHGSGSGDRTGCGEGWSVGRRRSSLCSWHLARGSLWERGDAPVVASRPHPWRFAVLFVWGAVDHQWPAG